MGGFENKSESCVWFSGEDTCGVGAKSIVSLKQGYKNMADRTISPDPQCGVWVLKQLCMPHVACTGPGPAHCLWHMELILHELPLAHSLNLACVLHGMVCGAHASWVLMLNQGLIQIELTD